MKYAVILSEKSSKIGPNMVKNLLQFFFIFQIQLMNQNFEKYFAKDAKIL